MTSITPQSRKFFYSKKALFGIFSSFFVLFDFNLKRDDVT